MSRLLFSPTTKLLELYFALNFFAIFAGPIIYPFAGSARKPNEIVLRHDFAIIPFIQEKSKFLLRIGKLDKNIKKDSVG